MVQFNSKKSECSGDNKKNKTMREMDKPSIHFYFYYIKIKNMVLQLFYYFLVNIFKSVNIFYVCYDLVKNPILFPTFLHTHHDHSISM